MCKLVEPKILPFARDVEYDYIEFYTIDVERVDDVALLPEEVSSLPSFLLYSGGELQEIVSIVSDKRPGRALAKAISRVYYGKQATTASSRD